MKPEVTYAEFEEAARATAHPAAVTHGGREYHFGNIVDPAALLDRLRED